MQAKVDLTQQQAVDMMQLAVQAQSMAQFASMTVSTYEAKINGVQHIVNHLQ